jgi:hypothetical protein
MTRPVPLSLSALAAAIALAAASPAHARNESLMRPVAEAMGKSHAREAAGDVPLLFGSASAAGAELLADAVEVQAEASIVADPRSRVHLTDEEACQKAFEDAVAQLASAARQAHAAAVVGIVSNFKGQRIDDAKLYDCHAGSSKSYVTLQARLARSYVAPGSRALPAATGFAPLEDAHAVPISDAGRERYAYFLTLPKPRAFVVYEDGGWRFYSKDPEAMTKALDYCAREGRRCWLYAADDRVVWTADVAGRVGSSAQVQGAPGGGRDEHQ